MILIPHSIVHALINLAQRAYPEECCGILLGHAASPQNPAFTILEHLPAENIAESRHSRYEINPRALLAAARRARERALEILGFYHSHPDHPATPSPTDAAQSWDHYLYLIIPTHRTPPQNSAPKISAWRFTQEIPHPIPLQEA